MPIGGFQLAMLLGGFQLAMLLGGIAVREAPVGVCQVWGVAAAAV
jgi:hypothetical protein